MYHTNSYHFKNYRVSTIIRENNISHVLHHHYVPHKLYNYYVST